MTIVYKYNNNLQKIIYYPIYPKYIIYNIHNYIIKPTNKPKLKRRLTPLNLENINSNSRKPNNQDNSKNIQTPSKNPLKENDNRGEQLLLDLFKLISNNEKKSEISPKEKIANQTIERTKIKYIDIIPKNINDLLKIISIIDTYNLDNNYNIDLKLLLELKEPLIELNELIGLESIKNEIFNIILYYLQHLDIRNNDFLHSIITGPPGTGKTVLASILAKIYVSLGILSNKKITKVKRSDLIGGYMGHTAIKTEQVLNDSLGGVLFIDEAYSLGNAGGKNGKDEYSKECINILNQFLDEHKNNFICIIAGYKEDIENSFFSMNDGLHRRFSITFSINNYSNEELKKIFIKKVNELNWSLDNNNINDSVINASFFKINRAHFKYYAGDILNLLTKCKYAHSQNLLIDKDKQPRVLSKKDIDDGLKIFITNSNINSYQDSNDFMYT